MNDARKKRTVEAIDRAMQYGLKTQASVGSVVINLNTEKTVPVDELYETVMLLRSTILNKDEVYVLQNLVRNEAGILSYTKSAPEYEKWQARLKTILEKLEVLSGQS